MYNEEKIVCFDFVRTLEDHVNYGIIESFKTGRLQSTKYESKIMEFDSCKVIVFANFSPNLTAWSADRYDIINVPRANK